MEIGSDWAGQTFYDILGNCSDTVTIDEDGGETSQSLKNLSAFGQFKTKKKARFELFLIS